LPMIVLVVWISIIAGILVTLAWGCGRWAKRKQPRTLSAALSVAGFSLATASALLAITSMLYAQAIGGFSFYDPRLLRIYRWGALLSFVGTVVALGGLWRPNLLRWHALVSALGTLVFWVLAAYGE